MEEEKSTGVNSPEESFAGSEVRQLSNLELIKKAEECADSLELEKAVSLYDEGLTRFPNDTVIID